MDVELKKVLESDAMYDAVEQAVFNALNTESDIPWVGATEAALKAVKQRLFGG